MKGRLVSAVHYLLCSCGFIATLFALAAAPSFGQTWDGGGVAGGVLTWTTAANWNPDGVPVNNGTANLIMANNIDPTNTVNVNFDVNSIIFNNTAGAFIISNSGGAILTVRGFIENFDSQTQTFAVPVSVALNQTWLADAGDLAFNTINLNANQLVLTGAQDYSFNGAISGAGGSMVKNNAGLATLNADNTFGGNFTLNSGTVQINATDALDAAAVIINGGALQSLTGPRVADSPLTVGGNFSTTGSLDLTFSGAATLTGDRTITTSNTALTVFSGAIGQDAAGRSLTKTGTGTLRFSGAAANTYTGTTQVAAGTLTLAKTAGVNAVAGSFLTIGDGIGGANADVVHLTSSNQVLDTTDVVVHTSGLFDLTGVSETIEDLQIFGGTVSTGVGTLAVSNQIFHEGSFNLTSTISGNLSLGGGTTTFNVESGTPSVDLDVAAVISNGNVLKTGNGTLQYSGSTANTYTGITTVSGGTLNLNKNDNVLALAGDLVINSGAIVSTENVGQTSSATDVAINNNGSGLLLGANTTIGSLSLSDGAIALHNASALTIAGLISVVNTGTFGSVVNDFGGGSVVLTGLGTNITVADGTSTIDFDISGSVISATGLTKNGLGHMSLSANSANAISGTTNINQGTLTLGKTAGLAAVSGNIIVGDGVGGADADVLRLDQNNQIAQTVVNTVTVNSSGFFDLNGRTEGIGNLQLNAGRVSGGTISFVGTVTSSAQATSAQINSHVDLLALSTVFTVNDGTAVEDLLMTGIIQNGSFTKTGSGTLKISGTSANSATLTQISNGTVILEKDAAINALGGVQVVVSDGAGPAQSDILRYGGNDNQLPDAIQVLIQGAGLFDLNGRSDTIGTLSLIGSGVVQTGAGTLTVANQVTAELNATAGTINGNLNLAGGSRPFNVANGASATDLTVAAAMSNSTLVKQGGGTLALTSSALSSSTSYQLDTGTLSAAGLAVDAAHAFTQNAGAFFGSLVNHGTFTYNAGTFNGQLNIESTGDATFNANFVAVNGISNDGAITIPAGRVVTASGSGLTNDGTIQLEGGTLQATATFNFINNDFISGHGELFGSNVNFVNAGAIVVSDGDLAINSNFSPINTGTIIVQSGLELQLPGTGNMQNSGLTLLNGGSVTGLGGTTNNLGGEVRGIGSFETPLTNAGGLVHATGTGTLIVNVMTANNAGGELRIDDGATLNVLNSFSSSGTIVLAGGNATFSGGIVTNTGTLRGLGRVNNTITNSGTIRAESGTLTLAATGHTNSAAGRIEAATGAQLIYSQGLAANSGQIALTGGSFDNNNVAMNNPGFIAGYGTLRTGGLTNTGFINVGGSLDVLGAVTQYSVVSTQSGTTVRFFGPVSGPGSYPGAGTVMFLNSFSPGASPAAVTFGGNVIFTASNTLIMELAGTAPGTEYDTITSGGTTLLGGTLDIDLLSGFIPSPGDSFQLITAAGGIVGTFSSVLFPSLPSAGWQLTYTPTFVLLNIGLKGDYNFDGAVDAADFPVWQKTLGTTGFGLPADGNGNNQIDPGDYTVWQNHFGESLSGSGSANSSSSDANVPEPVTLIMMGIAVLAAMTNGRRANR